MDDKAAAPTADAATETEAGNELSTVDHTTVTMEPMPSTSKSTITELDNTERYTVGAATAAAVAAAAAAATAREVLNVDTERCCWICFATDEDNRLAAWVQPCQCRGTTKWVHQSCLYRWIDEKTQKGSALRSVSCPQCQTEYIIVFPQMGKLGGALEAMDTLVKRLSPFLAAGFFVGSLYWTAVTYGAVTFLQVSLLIILTIIITTILMHADRWSRTWHVYNGSWRSAHTTHWSARNTSWPGTGPINPLGRCPITFDTESRHSHAQVSFCEFYISEPVSTFYSSQSSKVILMDFNLVAINRRRSCLLLLIRPRPPFLIQFPQREYFAELCCCLQYRALWVAYYSIQLRTRCIAHCLGV